MSCPKCTSNDWDHANVGLIGAILCTNCGELYMMKDETTLKTYNVYVEDFNGNYHDEYTIEAETIDKAYDQAYERLNWAAMEVHIEESEPSKALQDTYFEGKHPLEAFPSIFGGNPK